MRLNAYLNFNGQCEAAFQFYEQLLGGKIMAMMKYSDCRSSSPRWHFSDWSFPLVGSWRTSLGPIRRLLRPSSDILNHSRRNFSSAGTMIISTSDRTGSRTTR